MNDNEVTQEILGSLKAAVPDARMHTPVQHIISAAQSRRRRRGLATLAAAVLLVVIGLTLGVSSRGGGQGTPAAGPGGGKLAAWTVRTGPGGIITVTLRQLGNAHALQHVLAEHKVRAIVHAGDSICFQADGGGPRGVDRVVGEAQGRHPIVIHINPAAMPGRSKLLFSITRIHGTVRYVGFSLVHVGARVSCLHPPSYNPGTSQPPAQG
jgi:hypothetical protein